MDKSSYFSNSMSWGFETFGVSSSMKHTFLPKSHDVVLKSNNLSAIAVIKCWPLQIK